MLSELGKPVQVEYTTELKRNLRVLAKKYRHIKSDLQPIIDRLKAGEVIGDQIKGRQRAVFKVRVQNRDVEKGKSSGYRLIYQIKKPTKIILLTVYSKLEQKDISEEKISYILKEFEKQDI